MERIVAASQDEINEQFATRLAKNHGGHRSIISMTHLSQAIKQQIIVNLQTLVTNGVIKGFIAVDRGKDPFTNPPTAGYPFALVGMPRVANDMEDTVTNIRTYRFDILFVVNYENMPDMTYTIEGMIDAVLNQFDTNFTLEGTAIAAQVPPAQVNAFPISTPTQDFLAFVVTIEARTTLSARHLAAIPTLQQMPSQSVCYNVLHEHGISHPAIR